MKIYDGIDNISQERCIKAFNVLVEEFNHSDTLIKNFIANNLFNFLLSILTDEDAKDKIIEVYESLE